MTKYKCDLCRDDNNVVIAECFLETTEGSDKPLFCTKYDGVIATWSMIK